MAILALGAELAPMQVGVATGTLGRGLAKDLVDMAGTARHSLVHAP